jgi:hypothetical protein
MPNREENETLTEGWSTVLVTAVGSWGNLVPRGHKQRNIIILYIYYNYHTRNT